MPHTREMIILLLLYVASSAVQAAPPSSNGESPWTFEDVRESALSLSLRPYISPPNDLPQSLLELDYDAYRAINYRRSKALWTEQDVPFYVEFFHRGYLFKDQVEVYLIEYGQTVPVEFCPTLFHYNDGKPDGVKACMGFAGLRILYELDESKGIEEIISFIGTSYFRAVPLDGVYGASARGIAVDTIVAAAVEEFPTFRAFWVVRPASCADAIIIYALLDGPSIAGAYHFEITPGKEIDINVRASLFARRPINALGLAPLTSMFLYDQDTDPGPARPDKRPEVHDSDGLLLKTGADQWIWRPLRNPLQVGFSVFGVKGKAMGFGLLQRDRHPEHYKDPRTSPHKRPSVWVEMTGQWPQGRVELLELPSNSEGMDNIVAQYVVDNAPQAGTELALEYRLLFYSYEKPLHQLARVICTFSKAVPAGGMAYDIDFDGNGLADAHRSSGLKPDVTAVGGEVTEVRLSQAENVCRVSFKVAPKDGADIIELRASLISGEKAVSEIWSDQWKP